MIIRRTHTTLLALGCAAALGAGCGGSDEPKGKPIPRALAASLNKELDAVQRRFDEGGPGPCGDIEDRSQPDVERLLAQIPSNVDPEVRRALRQSFDRLWQLAGQQCNDTEPEPEPEPTVPEPEPEPLPTQPEPEPTQPEPEPEPTTPAPEPEPQPGPPTPTPPGNNRNGNGNGGGGGGGGGNGNDGGADFQRPGNGPQ